MSQTATLVTLAGVAMASSDPFFLSTSDALDKCLERNSCYDFDWDTHLRNRQDLLGCMNRIGVGTEDPIISTDLFDLVTPRSQRKELMPCLIEKNCFSKVDLVSNFYDREGWAPCMLGSNMTYIQCGANDGQPRMHRCINIWDGRPDYFTGEPQNLTNWPFPLNVEDLTSCMLPSMFGLPANICGAYSQVVPPNGSPVIVNCLAGTTDFDPLLRCFAEDAVFWTESGEQIVQCLLDDTLCGTYFDDSLASCFMNDNHGIGNPVSSNGLTFPIETGFAVGEEHMKCLLTKLNVSDAADYITRKMVEPEVLNQEGLNIGGCANYADYEEAW
jgi:hypothetical protein